MHIAFIQKKDLRTQSGYKGGVLNALPFHAHCSCCQAGKQHQNRRATPPITKNDNWLLHCASARCAYSEIALGWGLCASLCERYQRPLNIISNAVCAAQQNNQSVGSAL